MIPFLCYNLMSEDDKGMFEFVGRVTAGFGGFRAIPR